MTDTSTIETAGVGSGYMRAAILTDGDSKTFSIESVRYSAPAAEEVLVDVRASSLCHSDWNFIANDYKNPFPALLGHELAGVVIAIGDGVKSVKVGDHVVTCAVSSCGRCDRCLEGNHVWCEDPDDYRARADGSVRIDLDGTEVWQLAGLGGFAEKALVHESQVVAIDSAVPFDRAAVLGCAVVTGAGAVIHAANVRPRDTVLVFGAGGVGLSAIQAAALVGARKIIVVDVSDEKLELARRFGATHTINGKAVDPVDAVVEITDGRGVDHAFDMTGLAAPLRQGYESLGSGGTLYLVGMQKPGTEFALPASALRAGRGVRAVYMGRTNFRLDVPYFAELYLQGRFDLDDLVETHIRIDEINEGYARLLAGGGAGRTVITFD